MILKTFPGTCFLILFLFFSFLSQLFYPIFIFGSYLAFTISILLLIGLLFLSSRIDLFIFLYITCTARIIIPFLGTREMSLVLPSILLIVSLVRYFPRFTKINTKYVNILIFSFGIFLIFCFLGILNNIKIPGLNSVDENTGLLNRFNLLNSIIVFITGLILFDYQQFFKWRGVLFGFYLIVLFVSMGIILLDLRPFPLFNTFTWSLLKEDESSIKLVIAGVSSSFILIYTLVFVRKPILYYLLFLLSFYGLLISGSRISFLTGVLLVFIHFVAKRKVFGKSLIVFLIGGIFGFFILLSPFILLIPQKYQRLFIIFPPHYYTGKLAEFSNSAAASSTNFRLDIWERAIKKIKDSPFLGNSFDAPQADYNFQGSSLEGFKKIPTETLHNDFLVTGSLHNTFISIAYLLGLPALLCFIYFLIRLIWKHYRNSWIYTDMDKNISLFIFLILIYYFVAAMATDLLFNLEFFLFLAVALKMVLFHHNSNVIKNN